MTAEISAGPTHSTGYLLWHACRRWRRELSAALAPLGMTYAQWGLLASLHWLAPPGASPALRSGPSQKEVAAHAGIDPMVASEALRALEQRGLVRRQTSSGDRRARTLMITSEGARLALAGVDLVGEIDRRVFSGLVAPAEFEAELERIVGGGESTS